MGKDDKHIWLGNVNEPHMYERSRSKPGISWENLKIWLTAVVIILLISGFFVLVVPPR